MIPHAHQRTQFCILGYKKKIIKRNTIIYKNITLYVRVRFHQIVVMAALWQRIATDRYTSCSVRLYTSFLMAEAQELKKVRNYFNFQSKYTLGVAKPLIISKNGDRKN